jgi:hypothetical protein
MPDVNERMTVSVSGLATRDDDGFNWLFGRVSEQSVQEIELLYQDGKRLQLPFVWVSPPINAGFYAYDVPEQHEQPGRLTIAVIGRDDDGNTVAHRCLNVSPDEVARSVPEAAALCERHR